MNNKSKQYLKSLTTKKLLCEATMTLANEKGFNAIKISDITSAANVAKGSFYYYFNSKEDVFLYTYQLADSFYESSFLKSMKETNFESRFCSFIEIAYEEFEKFGREVLKACIIITLSRNNSPFQAHRRFLTYLDLILADAIANNDLSANIDFDQFKESLFACLIGSEYIWCLNTTQKRLSEIVICNVRSLLCSYTDKK